MDDPTVLLQVAVECHDHGPVVRAVGEVDLVNHGDLDEAIRQACESAGERQTVTVDLTEVTFFGSSGVAALVTASRGCASAGVALVIVAGPVVRRVLQVTGVEQALTVTTPDHGPLRSLAE